MNTFPEFYQLNPIYKDHCYYLIRDKMKSVDFGLLFDTTFYRQGLQELGYELSKQEETYLEAWLQNLIHLSFLTKTVSEHRGAIEEVILHNESWIQVIGDERREYFGPFLSQDDFQLALEIFALREKQLWNHANPFQSFQVRLRHSGWRATLVHNNLNGKISSKLFLRSQREENFKLDDFQVTLGQQELIKKSLTKKKNILVCGSTGSGKTSFLKTLTQMTPEREHLITLEDTKELSSNNPFSTHLIAKRQNGYSLVDYCHYALRMRPDRIIIGEIRSHEVVPFLLSINTGHGGMMASLHANSSIDALHRLCLLFQIYSTQTSLSYPEVLKLVCEGIDFIFYLQDKKVTDIMEIKGAEGSTPFYETWN